MRLSEFRQRRRLQASPLLVERGAVTLNLPCEDKPEMARLLSAALPLWEAQTVSPVIDVINCRRVVSREWRHPSEPVAMACELTQLTAATEFVLFSHVDVFPRRRDLVEWLRSQCSAECPVVGYEISPRDMQPGRMATEWRGMVGHTLTMIHVPTIRTAGVTWSYDRAFTEFGWTAADHWDTEVTFNLALRAADISAELVGHDENYTHKIDDWHAHARSYPSAVISGADHQHTARPWVEQEIAEAKARVAEWTS